MSTLQRQATRSAGALTGAFMNQHHRTIELRQHLQRLGGRLAMRRVADARQQRHIDRAVAFLAGDLDLADATVLIGGALDDRDGHADIGEIV